MAVDDIPINSNILMNPVAPDIKNDSTEKTAVRAIGSGTHRSRAAPLSGQLLWCLMNINSGAPTTVVQNAIIKASLSIATSRQSAYHKAWSVVRRNNILPVEPGR